MSEYQVNCQFCTDPARHNVRSHQLCVRHYAEAVEHGAHLSDGLAQDIADQELIRCFSVQRGLLKYDKARATARTVLAARKVYVIRRTQTDN